jgi:hypothetical protein
MTTTPQQKQTARQQLTAWIRDYMTDKDEVSASEMVSEAVIKFRKNRKFLDELAVDALRELVYRRAVEEMARSRRAGKGPVVMTGDDVLISTKGIKQRARGHSVFQNWLEHAGDRHVRIMDATREDLLLAAEEREGRGEHEIRLAKVWRTVAETLEGGQVVNTKYSPEEVERIYRGMDNS